MVWEALRALYLIGNSDDLADVARYARGVDGMSPQIARQAQATMKAIRDRNQSRLPRMERPLFVFHYRLAILNLDIADVCG